MDTTELNAALVAVPADDGVIGQALDELDARIAAWVAAVAHAQSAVAGLAELEARNAELSAARAIAASAAQVQAVAPVSAPIASAPPAGPSVQEAAVRPSKKSAGLRVGHLTDKEPAPPAVRHGIMVYEEDSPEVEKADTTAADAEEALLAQLDPALARQIRIKRRLCNNSKTVRQLLDEEKKVKKGKK